MRDICVSDDFTFDSGLETVGRDLFLRSREHAGVMEDLEILEVWPLDDRAVVMFEATDSVTNLRHRSCWMIVFNGNRALSVRSCFGPAIQRLRE